MRESWPEHLKRNSQRAVAGSLMKRGLGETLEFIEKNELGWLQLANAVRDAGAEGTLFNDLDQLPDGWLDKMVDVDGLFLRSPRALSFFDYGADELGLSDARFEKLLVEVAGGNFTSEQRPEILEILNNKSLPFEVGKKLIEGQIDGMRKNGHYDLEGFRKDLHRSDFQEFAATLPAPDFPLIGRLFEEQATKIRKDPAAAIRDDGTLISAHSGKWSTQQAKDAIAAWKGLPLDKKLKISLFDNDPFTQQGDSSHPEFHAFVYHDLLKNAPLDRKPTVESLATFGTTWAANEPSLAAAWAVDLPPGEARNWTLKNIARQWSYFSETESAEWVSSLSESDRAVISTNESK